MLCGLLEAMSRVVAMLFTCKLDIDCLSLGRSMSSFVHHK